MIDISKTKYRLVATAGGQTWDLTPAVTALTWSESDRELACKINFKCPLTEDTKYLQPLTPIAILVDSGGGFNEIVRGTVQKVEMSETNGELILNAEAADAAISLRQSQGDLFFNDDSSAKSILEGIFKETGAPVAIEISDVKCAKKVYRGKFYADMIQDVLKDIKEKGGGVYMVRVEGDTIKIIPRGTNETVYHFDIDNDLIRVRESFDVSKAATQIKIVGKQREEGKQKVESVVEGDKSLGTRTRIYLKGDKETVSEAETAAKKILDEQGGAERKTSIEAPDIPAIRKGDKIRMRNSLGEAYFFIKSITHNALTQKMRAELDYDTEGNAGAGYTIAANSETKDA